MGGVVSSILDGIKSVLGYKNDRKKRADQEARYATQHDVPFFYKNRVERNLHVVKNTPYSIQGITAALNRGILPVGYSAETLKLVGFEKEYNDMLEREDKRIKDSSDQLRNNYKLLLKNITAEDSDVFKTSRGKDLVDKINTILNRDIEDETVADLNQDIVELQGLTKLLNLDLKQLDDKKTFMDKLNDRKRANATSIDQRSRRIGQLIIAQALHKAPVGIGSIGEISKIVPVRSGGIDTAEIEGSSAIFTDK